MLNMKKYWDNYSYTVLYWVFHQKQAEKMVISLVRVASTET